MHLATSPSPTSPYDHVRLSISAMAPSSRSRRLHLLLLLLLAFTLVCGAASRAVPNDAAAVGKAYTKVCDATRFAGLGLNMSDFAYCDASLPYAERVADLIGRMTVEEKVASLGDQAAGAPRIGLPKYMWWSEALHGLSSTGPTTKFDDLSEPASAHSGRAAVYNATVFATVLNSAASFNESLWKSIGQAISTEARAMYNLGKGGLTYWSPNINVVRDPRWGRAAETPGEDPYVVGRYAVNFVRGMQDVPGKETAADPDARPLKTSACCKHYAAYDVDEWHGHSRFTFDSRVEERDMAETFLRPFEMCVRDGDVSSVMCSYNRVNGVPACADARLLSGTIRGEWDLHGYIVSDCDAVRVMTDNATWLGYTPAESAAASVRAGLDLDCGESWIIQDGKPMMDFLTVHGMEAVRRGKLRESDIDNALKNLYMTLMRVGFFDDIPQYASLDEKDICSDEHRALALDGARQGMVLLKNDDNLLPLDAGKLRAAGVALRGPHVDAPERVMDADYTGPPCQYVTPRKGISKDVKIVKHANTTIYFGGLNLHIEREGNDREDIFLPKNQTEEILRIAKASPKPIVLVIFSGGGIDLSFAQNNPKIGAILWAGYPGGEGGNAIADVIFGRYNPGGRLPLTWFKNSYIHKLPMTSMALRPVTERGYPGRTYKFYDGEEVLYPFGHGLSYTKFLYETTTNGTTITLPTAGRHCKELSYKDGVAAPACPAINVDGHACPETVSFNVSVINGGEKDGTHPVIVYTAPPPEVAGAPIKQVVAFQRVFVKAWSTVTVQFTLNVCKAFGIVEKTAYTVVPSGISTVMMESGESSVSFPVKIRFS